MSLILWYKVVIEEPAAAGGLLAGAASLLGLGFPITVSSDVFSGSYILDAAISLEMKSGPAASTFEVKLVNLPKDLVDKIKDRQRSGLAEAPPSPLQVKIFLGYLEDLPALTAKDPVMVGALRGLKSEVNAGGMLETTLRGEELSGYRLRTSTRFQHDWSGTTTAGQVLEDILAGTGVELAGDHGLTASLEDFTLTARNRLEALEAFARKREIQAPLVVRDGRLLVNKSVGAGAPVASFSADENLVAQIDRQDGEELRDAPDEPANGSAAAAARAAQQVVVLGNPRLRAGQPVSLALPDGAKKTYRALSVKHSFSNLSGGYTCELLLVDVPPGERAEAGLGVEALANTLQGVAARAQAAVIDVGQVREYTPGASRHVATLYYGQSPAAETTAASVQSPVDETVQLHNLPLLAPFAFHKVGLIVPVYPGMRALLAHNRGQVRDAVVSGFLWPDEPAAERPASEAGDYWLCLPTELDGEGRPTGKGVNDLTDSAGHRVIQARAFQLSVGDSKLANVGARPSPPEADTLVIEHKSGTKITIGADGKITIETSQKELALTNGSVTLALNGSTVEIR